MVFYLSIRGKVVIVVNVASECGLTKKNYAQLQELHSQYSNQGLVILAFPCNQFGGQEPGSSEEFILPVDSWNQIKFT